MTTETAPTLTGAEILFKLADPEVLDAPWPLFKLVRDNYPVLAIPEMNAFFLTRYDDVNEAARDAGSFSNAWATSYDLRELSLSKAGPKAAQIMRRGFPFIPALIFTDDPAHKRHRALLQQTLSVRRVAQLEAFMTETVNALVDGFLAAGSTELVSEFSELFPMYVIAAALGLPKEDTELLPEWKRAANLPLGRVLTEEEDIYVAEQLVGMHGYLAARIEERRLQPSDDLLSDLVHAKLPGEDGDTSLSLGETLVMAQQFIVAGQDTSALSIPNCIHLLLEHPELIPRILEDTDAMNSFIDEALRFESPAQGLPRKATKDIVLHDTTIPEGSLVLLMFGAANRDERIFESPDEFNIDRKSSRPHLAFSQGAHFCIGHALAKAELRIALTTLFTRLPNLRLVDGKPPKRRGSFTLRGYDEFWLEFDS